MSCAVVAIANVYIPWQVWQQLPARVPTHFGASGRPDEWGSKMAFLAVPIIGTLTYVLMTVISQFPKLMNSPWLTPGNEQRQYEISRHMLLWMKLWIGLLLG